MPSSANAVRASARRASRTVKAGRTTRDPRIRTKRTRTYRTPRRIANVSSTRLQATLSRRACVSVAPNSARSADVTRSRRRPGARETATPRKTPRVRSSRTRSRRFTDVTSSGRDAPTRAQQRRRRQRAWSSRRASSSSRGRRRRRRLFFTPRRARAYGFRFRREVLSRRERRGKRGKRLRLETPPPPRSAASPHAGAGGGGARRSRDGGVFAAGTSDETTRASASSSASSSFPENTSQACLFRLHRRVHRRVHHGVDHGGPVRRRGRGHRLGVARSATRRRLLARVKHPRGVLRLGARALDRALVEIERLSTGLRGSARGEWRGLAARSSAAIVAGFLLGDGTARGGARGGTDRVRTRARLGSVIRASARIRIDERPSNNSFCWTRSRVSEWANKNGKNSKCRRERGPRETVETRLIEST